MSEAKEGTLVTQPQEHSLMEIQNLERVKEQFGKLQQFIKSQMREDIDFGTIPGCKKPSLYKPGAEKLLNLHGLACRLSRTVDCILDFKGGFINYAYAAEVYNPRTGIILAVSEGSCNSKEAKYKTQEVHTILNTLQKMAQKRAMVGATLMACRASDIFTDQDDAPAGADKTDGGQAASKSAGNATAGTKKITEGQQKLVYARYKGGNIDDATFKGYLADAYGVDHTKDIAAPDLEAILAWIEENKK